MEERQSPNALGGESSRGGEIPRVLNDATFGMEASLGFPSRHPEPSSRVSLSPTARDAAAESPRVFGEASRAVDFIPSSDLEISRVSFYPDQQKHHGDISSSLCHDNAPSQEISMTLGTCSSPSKFTHMSSLSKLEENQIMSQWVHTLVQDTPLDLSRATNTAGL